jgi:RNA polymerase sigma factor (sigma-70 family)
MKPRQNLLEQFSMFLQFADGHAAGWATDARLRRSMQQSAKTLDGTSSEHYWVVYWHKRWRQAMQTAEPKDSPAQAAAISLGHLVALLQETGYWAAHKAALRLEGVQMGLADCFQVAIAGVPKILKAFDAEQSPSLKTYAAAAFSNTIRDELRQRREVDRCSDWGLLLKLSRKQFTEALQHAGFGEADVQRYLLAWACFNDGLSLQKIQRPQPGAGKLRQLSAPDAATWGAIAQAYNQQRSALAAPGSEVSAATLERWLIASAQRARAYLYPPVGSLNWVAPGQDSGELQDSLPDAEQATPWQSLIAEEDRSERQSQQQQLSETLNAAFAQLDPDLQHLLRLYYQQRLTQQQIAKQAGIPQYSVSRQLSRARGHLLLALTQWSQATLHISLTSDVITYISATLEEWLHHHLHAEPGINDL